MNAPANGASFDEPADALQAFEEAAVKCRSNTGCMCEPSCTDECYVGPEDVTEVDECALAHDLYAMREAE